jgi:hypothetical protein
MQIQKSGRTRTVYTLGVCAGLSVLTINTSAQGALQVALGKVNTSVGVLPTSVTNKWKLETDPAFTPSDDIDLSTYVPIDGELSDTYDPTKFMLATDDDGNYGLETSVVGVGPYQVTGFDVLMNGGGNVSVQENPSDPETDTITKTGTTDEGEFGEIDDIQFALIADERSQAMPATVDQVFYDINLVTIGPGGDGFVPGIVTAFPGPDGFLTIGSNDPNADPLTITTPSADINSSTNVPEPLSISFFTAGALGAIYRRRRRA